MPWRLRKKLDFANDNDYHFTEAMIWPLAAFVQRACNPLGRAR